MNAALTVRLVREHAGLSKRELARRARTSPAAVVAYESGARDPTVGTLVRLLAAAGASGEIDLDVGPRGPDAQVNAERLREVLELAEHLPRRRASPELAYPTFPGRGVEA